VKKEQGVKEEKADLLEKEVRFFFSYEASLTFI